MARADGRPEALELRVRRLEDAVAMLQDTRHLEDRIVERVASRVQKTAPQQGPASTGIFTSAGRHLLPATLNRGSTRIEEVDGPTPTVMRGLRGAWFVMDLYDEARTMIRMFFDPRYRPTWVGRMVPPLLFVAILTSWIWVPGTGLLFSSVATVIDKTIDLVLAFVAFKVLAREARLYRETVSAQNLLPKP